MESRMDTWCGVERERWQWVCERRNGLMGIEM